VGPLGPLPGVAQWGRGQLHSRHLRRRLPRRLRHTAAGSRPHPPAHLGDVGHAQQVHVGRPARGVGVGRLEHGHVVAQALWQRDGLQAAAAARQGRWLAGKLRLLRRDGWTGMSGSLVRPQQCFQSPWWAPALPAPACRAPARDAASASSSCPRAPPGQRPAASAVPPFPASCFLTPSEDAAGRFATVVRWDCVLESKRLEDIN
jgi:hypothetical protein